MKHAARIKRGAIVFSDHSFPVWGEHIGVGQEDRLFECDPLDTNHNRYDLRAHGFGLQGVAYGNGSLFVSASDVEFLEVTEKEYNTIFKPAFPEVKLKKMKPGYYLNNNAIVKVIDTGQILEIGDITRRTLSDYTSQDFYGPIDLHEIKIIETCKAKRMSVDMTIVEDIKVKNLRNRLLNNLDLCGTAGLRGLTMSHDDIVSIATKAFDDAVSKK